MSEWKTIKLNTITEFLNRGISPKYSDSGNLIVNQKCIRENRLSYKEARYSDIDKRIADDRKLKIGDILVNSTGTGTLGRTAQVKEIHCVTSVDTHVTIVRINSKFDSRFIAYQLAMKEPEIVALGKGATNQQELGREELGNLEINLPPLPTQRRIASILSAYDDLIENNLKRIRLLEELAQRTYEEWFVKFRINGEPLAIDEKTGLPVGWEITSVSEYVKIISKGPSLNYDFEGLKYPVLNQSCIRNGEIELEKILFAQELNKGKEDCYLKQNDILINSMGQGTLGRVSKNISINEKYIIHNCITFLRAKDNLSQYQLFYFLASKQTYFESVAQGSTGQTTLKISLVQELEMPLAPEIILAHFNKLMKPIWYQMGKLKNQNNKLRQSRDILLPRLMSGKINVE